MKTIDRYIARAYITNVAALFVILFTFVVAIDVSLQLEKYTSLARRLTAGDGQVGFGRLAAVTAYLVADFWWPNLIRLFNYMVGLVMVGAMGFTLTQMVRHRELVALLSSGVSLYRVARPILVVALLLTGLQLANREFLLPKIAPLLLRDQKQSGMRAMGEHVIPLTPDAQGRLWYAPAYNPDEGVMRNPYIYERNADGELQRRIVADAAAWDGAVWQLDNGRIDQRQGAAGAHERVLFVESNLDPTLLAMRRFAGFSQNLSFAQVTRMLEHPDLLGADAAAAALQVRELKRIRSGRFAIASCNLLALLTALTFFLRREPANMLAQSLRCSPVAMVALMGGVIGANLNIAALPPGFTPFVPAVVLLPIAIAAITSIRS